jgi:hypothetical protein
MFEDADLIHRYTRADALRDGVLIDVSQTAREAGIRYPVGLLAARISDERHPRNVHGVRT